MKHSNVVKYDILICWELIASISVCTGVWGYRPRPPCPPPRLPSRTVRSAPDCGVVAWLRRVFDYRTRHVDFEVEVPPLPSCLENVLGSMEERGLKPVRPDQLTLNEYKP